MTFSKADCPGRRPTPVPSRSVRGRMAGQSLIIFALFALVLIGFMGLAVDGGFILAERRQIQNAADAGAVAAAKSLSLNRIAEIQPAGQYYGGTVNGGANTTTVVNWPPQSGPYAGNNRYVEVTATKPVRRFFLGAVYSGAWEVTARAVAGVEPVQKPYALMAVQPGGGGMHLGGTVRVTLQGPGSAMSNANVSNTGTSNIFSAGGSIDAAGTIQSNPSWSAPDGLNAGQNIIADPLATTPPPPVPSIAFTTSTVFWNDAGTAPIADCDTTCTMKPGLYNDLGTITIKGTASLAEGIYYLSGNTSLSLGNTNSLIQGNKVMLYVTGQANLRFHNGGMRLFTNRDSPAYPGGLKGMLLWIANCTTFRNSGNGIFEVEGVIYAPCSTVNLYGGGSSAAQGVQVIVGELTLQGGGFMNFDYREYVGFSVPKTWLVE
jgi:Flp pilus assembly protein TadG